MKAYLEKIQENLYEKKYEIVNHMTDLKNEYKENIEMMRLLEESEDKIFESFTPRIINSFEKVKSEEIKQRQKILLQDIHDTETKLKDIDADIDEINNIVKKEISIRKNIDTLEEKLRLCNQLIYKDVYQCKKELETIESIIHNIKDVDND